MQPDGAPLSGETMAEAYAAPGTLVNSGEFDGLAADAAIERMSAAAEERGRSASGRSSTG